MTTLILFLLFNTYLQPPVVTATPPSKPVDKAAQLTNGGVPAKAPATDAEKIANAQDSIKKAKQAVEKIQKRLEDPEGEYQKAEAEFSELNTKLKDVKATASKFRGAGDEKRAADAEATMPSIQEDWQLAKERFDIAIRQKKESLEAIAGLNERVAADQQLLDRLEGKTPLPVTTKPASGEKTIADKPIAEKPTREVVMAPRPSTSVASAPNAPPTARVVAEPVPARARREHIFQCDVAGNAEPRCSHSATLTDRFGYTARGTSAGCRGRPTRATGPRETEFR